MSPTITVCCVHPRWLAQLWNTAVVPRVEEAVISQVTAKHSSSSSSQRPSPSSHALSSGQQAVVKAALSILVNKAVLSGCPLPRHGEWASQTLTPSCCSESETSKENMDETSLLFCPTLRNGQAPAGVPGEFFPSVGPRVLHRKWQRGREEGAGQREAKTVQHQPSKERKRVPDVELQWFLQRG